MRCVQNLSHIQLLFSINYNRQVLNVLKIDKLDIAIIKTNCSLKNIIDFFLISINRINVDVYSITDIIYSNIKDNTSFIDVQI